MLRSAVVAGYFYPGRKESLLETVDALIAPAALDQTAIALMSPHAGYVYSGGVAGRTFSGVRIPEEIIILGPNHHEVSQSQLIPQYPCENLKLILSPEDKHFQLLLKSNLSVLMR